MDIAILPRNQVDVTIVLPVLQICYHLCQAVSLYFRVHFVSSVMKAQQEANLMPETPITCIGVGQEELDVAIAKFDASRACIQQIACEVRFTITQSERPLHDPSSSHIDG